MKHGKRHAMRGLVALLLLLIPAGAAHAHAELVRSDPAAGAVLERPPERVRLFFSEPIEPELFALEVYSHERVRVDRRDAQIPADNVAALEAGLVELSSGTYTVVWRVLSIDGHVVRGVFAFSVGAAVEGASPLSLLPAGGAPFGLTAAVRWLTFLCAFALAGGLGFLPLILWPALRAAGVSDPAPARRAGGRLLWVAWIALALLLLLNLAALLLQAADATGLSPGEVFRGRAITRLLVATRYGTLWLVRMALLLGLLAVVAAISAGVGRGPALHWVGLGLGAALLLTISASGHASAVPRQTAVAVAADWAHLLAGAVWIGGLIQLALGLPAALRELTGASRRVLLARVVQRFSWMAGLSVATLIATGVYAGLIHVPSWQALADTVYGAALTGKLILFAPLLAIGAINLLVLHPLFVRAARAKASAAGDSVGFRLFRALVLGEISLAVLVLAVTGILAGLPPATSAVGEGQLFSETRRLGDLSVTLTVRPNRVGTNRIEIAIDDPEGRPVEGGQVTLRLGHLEMDMGEREVVAERVDPGRYLANGDFFSMEGRWQVDVRVQRSGATGEQATFQVTPGPAPSSGRPAFSPARILLNALTPWAALGALALLLAALVLVFLVWRVGWERTLYRRREAWIAAILLVAGVFAAGRALAGAYRASLLNPVAATAESVARGRQIYVQNCASCHGAQGRGDGPAGFALRPRPADLRVHMAAGHTDSELFGWIAGGVAGTGMPAFREQLSEQEIWDVVNFIRTFAQEGR